jgi:CheY-like chemotaxis protein
MLSKWLRRRGFDVVTAADGEQGLTEARISGPDIILMDITLPVYDGLEVTRRLKADPATSHIPIVALTAHVSGEDRDEALAAGCVAFSRSRPTSSGFSTPSRTVFWEHSRDPYGASSHSARRRRRNEVVTAQSQSEEIGSGPSA